MEAHPPAVGATPREARAASCLVRDLARSIGVVQRGDPVPKAIRQQRWSQLNVLLTWAAAGDEAQHPVLNWLAGAARRVQEPLECHGGQTTATEAVREGWNVPRAVVRTWQITSQQQLTELMVRQPRVSAGNHIASRAQEFTLWEAVMVDARGTVGGRICHGDHSGRTRVDGGGTQ